ncbi:MAG: Hsp20/alpha crystallin family protein [Verrucomicrobia bacterium]|nr:Hsp20/alpha crystallin family protein [Verrucomicrobiota bacterium]MBV9656691.1 Hsp20/alpha crystallin family protein [Verrucomicrobiota bacterium]
MNIIRYQTPSAVAPVLPRLSGLSALSSEMDRLFSAFPFFGGSEERFEGWQPAVDLYHDKDSVLVRAELPGMNKEDIHVSLHEDVLTLSGERRQEKSHNEKGNLRSERYFGKFERRFTLPVRVDSRRVAASYEDGVLTVTLPKAEEAKPRQIEVNVK